MTPLQKKPGVAFWATVVVVVALVTYPLSFGPACWWLTKRSVSPVAQHVMLRRSPHAYWPVGCVALHSPRLVMRAINWYATLGVGGDAVWCDTEPYPTTGGVMFMASFNRTEIAKDFLEGCEKEDLEEP